MRRTYLIPVLVILVALAIFGLSAGSASAGPLIVIDPGHSGGTLLSIDPQFNMYDYEYNGGQENYDNWNVAVALKAKLETAGYRVLLTKTGPEDIVSKRARVNLGACPRFRRT
jgi:N-acetylmuramoyl-L-alanine amidase